MILIFLMTQKKLLRDDFSLNRFLEKLIHLVNLKELEN